MDLPRRYLYGPNVKGMLAFAVFLGGGAWVLFHVGTGVITAVAWLSIVLACMAAVVGMAGWMVPARYVELETAGVRLPIGPIHSKKSVWINYPDIRSVTELEGGGQLFLQIATADGEYGILKQFMPNAESYGELRTFLMNLAMADQD